MLKTKEQMSSSTMRNISAQWLLGPLPPHGQAKRRRSHQVIPVSTGEVAQPSGLPR